VLDNTEQFAEILADCAPRSTAQLTL